MESAIAGDPLGQWITANALRSWTDDALTVLENLPCTGQELHEVARSEGWCATWWNLWSQAVRDGVVTDVSSVRRMIDALAERGVTATWESTGGGFCDIISAPYVRDGTIARVSSYLAALNLAVALTTESVCVVPECGEPVAERGACEGQWCPEHWAEHTREYPACAALYWAAVKASEW